MYDVQENSFSGKSEEMDQRACRALNQTWEVIGYDLLVDDQGKPDYRKTMSRKEVAEIVQDASHMTTYGGDFEAAHYTIWLSRYHKTHHAKLIKRAFPSGRFGW
jgi:hypothetical protein